MNGFIQRWHDYQPTKTQALWMTATAVAVTLIIGFGLAGWVTAAPLVTAVRAAQTPPDVLVKATSEEVLKAIKQNPGRTQLLELAKTKIVAHFDFEQMTRLAVGRSWNRATPEQQERLQQEFRDLLVRTYTSALTALGQAATVEVKPVRRERNDDEVTVDTQIHRAGAPPIQVTYRMERQADGWKVYDVVVEGMSLVTTYRHTFRNEVRIGGVEGLIKALNEKNESLAGG